MELSVVGSGDIRIRPARQSDHDAVCRLCEDIWSDRDGDYLPRVYPQWIRGDDRNTLVAIDDTDVVGIAQCVLLTPHEAWCQGLRVHEDKRGQGIAATIMQELFAWARKRGATVARSMVFSWNRAGMGVARGVGFEPTTSFRFVTPAPSGDELPAAVVYDGERGWNYWQQSDANSHLHGLGLDDSESWAMRKLKFDDMTNNRTLTIADGEVTGVALRGRRENFDDKGETIRRQEYIATAWDDLSAANTLFRAIAFDANEQGATHTRVVIAEDITAISDAAAAGVPIDAEPHFIFSFDLRQVEG